MVNLEKSQNATEESARLPPDRTERNPLLVALASLGFLLCLAGNLYSWRVGVTNHDTYAVCTQRGKIYTVDQQKPSADCIGIKNSLISFVGTREELHDAQRNLRRVPLNLRQLFSPQLKELRMKPGHIVVPGLADAHAHLIEYGFTRQLDLNGTQSVQEVVDRVRNYILDRQKLHNDTSEWIVGMGWDQTKWIPSQFPKSDDLNEDPVLKGRPIALRRVDGHALWVSPRVLDTTGELPRKVVGGEIIRDQAGQPTGVFLDNAMELIPIPPLSAQQMQESFDLGVKDALANGLTAIHDAGSSPSEISFFMRMAEEDRLPIRLYAMGRINSDEYWGDQIPKLIDYGTTGHLNVHGIKLVSDGALGSWGAALLEPYSDRPDSNGILLTSEEVLDNLTRSFWRDGYQVNVHCIGDRANNVMLDIFEGLLKDDDVRLRRPRIEHAQIMRPSDLERISKLGVIPSVQPTHATSDMWYAEKRLGEERMKGAYAYRSLLELSDAHILPLGSDFPVEGINPILGFYAAVTRLAPDGTSPHGDGGWFPEQRLTRPQALKGMTYDAAYASFAENELGSLTVGKRADFVVLDTDIMAVETSDILKTTVQATVVDGRVMYGHL